MDKRKLIGTIIGVIMFAMLIVGATYAWLTISVTTTNGNYSAKTRNFVITYVAGGGSILKTIGTSNATIANITQETDPAETDDGWTRVSASKGANTAKASSFIIKMHITSSTVTTKAVTWALCKGACPTNVALATVSSGTATCGTGVTACGTFEPGVSNVDVNLYNDTTTFNVDGAVAENQYNVYVWIDSGTMVNADLGKKFQGYIHASATQGD